MMTHGNEMSADAYEPCDFAYRHHIGPSPEEIAEMLRVVGASSLEGLRVFSHGKQNCWNENEKCPYFHVRAPCL